MQFQDRSGVSFSLFASAMIVAIIVTYALTWLARTLLEWNSLALLPVGFVVLLCAAGALLRPKSPGGLAKVFICAVVSLVAVLVGEFIGAIALGLAAAFVLEQDVFLWAVFGVAFLGVVSPSLWAIWRIFLIRLPVA